MQAPRPPARARSRPRRSVYEGAQLRKPRAGPQGRPAPVPQSTRPAKWTIASALTNRSSRWSLARAASFTSPGFARWGDLSPGPGGRRSLSSFRSSYDLTPARREYRGRASPRHAAAVDAGVWVAAATGRGRTGRGGWDRGGVRGQGGGRRDSSGLNGSGLARLPTLGEGLPRAGGALR